MSHVVVVMKIQLERAQKFLGGAVLETALSLMPALLTSTFSLPKSRRVASIAAAQFGAGNKSWKSSHRTRQSSEDRVATAFRVVVLVHQTAVAPRARNRGRSQRRCLAPPVISTTLP